MVPQSEKDAVASGSTPSIAEVREQLNRLLAHPLFSNSKRYPVLLAYAVEQTLLGKESGLKERSVGVEAFGREPDYDVALDPVVRMAAAEVRKRLSQYYYDPNHAGELVIELPVGSYVPSFRDPATHQTSSSTEGLSPDAAEACIGHSNASTARVADSEPLASRNWIRNGILFAGFGILAALVGYGVGRTDHSKGQSDVDRFWKPMIARSSRVTYCLGEPALADDRVRATPEGRRLYGSLDVSDVITLARSIVPLVPRNAGFRVAAASETGFSELREGPVVLIGAFDNVWDDADHEGSTQSASSMNTMCARSSIARAHPGRPGPSVVRFRTRTLLKTTQSWPRDSRSRNGPAGGDTRGDPGRGGPRPQAKWSPIRCIWRLFLQRAPKNWEKMSLEAVIRNPRHRPPPRPADNHRGPGLVGTRPGRFGLANLCGVWTPRGGTGTALLIIDRLSALVPRE